MAGFQGMREDAPDPKIPNFTAVYGPLFTTHSPLGSFGHLYGMLRMLHTLLVIWLIGSTIKTTAKGIESPPSDNAHQLIALAFTHWAQTVIIFTQWPYNERAENVIQMFVSGCQGAFFFTLGRTVAGDEPDANQLNNINLLAMTVVVVASAKGSAISARKKVMKILKGLQGAIAAIKPFIEDPHGFMKALLDPQPSDAMPLLDAVPFNSYVHSATLKHTPFIFQHSTQTDTAQFVREVADQWRLEQGWTDAPFDENIKGSKMGVGKNENDWLSQRFAIFTTDVRLTRRAHLEARIYSALKDRHRSTQEDAGIPEDSPTMQHRFNVMAHRAAAWYSSDYVFTCHTLELVALQETQYKMMLLDTLSARGALGDLLSEQGQTLHDDVEIILTAQLRSLKDQVSVALAKRAQELGGVSEWPPANLTDLHTWATIVQALRAEVNEVHVGEWMDVTRRINTIAKAEAVLFVAAENDAARLERKETAVQIAEYADEAADVYCVAFEYAAPATAMNVDDEEEEAEEELEPDYNEGDVYDQSRMFPRGGSADDEVLAGDDTEPEPVDKTVMGTTGGPLLRGVQDEKDSKRLKKEAKLTKNQKYAKWRENHIAAMKAAEEKRSHQKADEEKRYLASHLPPLVQNRVENSPASAVLVEHDELIAHTVHEYCFALFEILCQAVAEGYQRFPPTPQIPSLVYFPEESKVADKFANLLCKYELEVSKPQFYQEACYVAESDYAVQMAQLETARQIYWQSIYTGSIRPWEESGEWTPKLVTHAMEETFAKAYSSLPVIFEANEELSRSRLQFIHGFMEQTISPGLQEMQDRTTKKESTFVDEVDITTKQENTFVDEVDITIGLDAIVGNQDPKRELLDEFAGWLVAQFQQHFEPAIYCPGRVLDLPVTVLHSVVWAMREAQKSLFYGDKYSFANNVIENVVTPVLNDFLLRFQEKVRNYDPNLEVDDQATMEFQAQLSKQPEGTAIGDADDHSERNQRLAEEVLAYAEQLLSSEGEFGTGSLESLLNQTLEQFYNEERTRARVEVDLQRVPQPELEPVKRLASFVANAARTVVLLHLSKRELPLPDATPPTAALTLVSRLGGAVHITGLLDGQLCGSRRVSSHNDQRSRATLEANANASLADGSQLAVETGARGWYQPGTWGSLCGGHRGMESSPRLEAPRILNIDTLVDKADDKLSTQV